MPRNITYHNPIHQEENTPLVKVLEVNVALNQATAIDARKVPYLVDLSKASFGGVTYPEAGSQWLLKKVNTVWTLMARGPQQNPQLDPSITASPGDTVIGHGGQVIFAGDGLVLQDVNLFRSSTNLWATDDSLLFTDKTKQIIFGSTGGSTANIAIQRALAADLTFSSFVTGDTQRRLQTKADGKIEWGSGSATQDTNLYRSAADTLKTDDSFVVGAALTVTTTSALAGVTATGTVNVTSAGDLQYNSISLPRGVVGYVVSTSDTSAISTGTALQTSSLSYPTGRAYRMTHGAVMLSNTANNTSQILLRAGTGSPSSGTVGSGRTSQLTTANGIWQIFEAVFVNTTGSTITGTAAAVIVSGGATTTTEKAENSTPQPRYVLVEDIGPSSLFSSAPTMS